MSKDFNFKGGTITLADAWEMFDQKTGVKRGEPKAIKITRKGKSVSVGLDFIRVLFEEVTVSQDYLEFSKDLNE